MKKIILFLLFVSIKLFSNSNLILLPITVSGNVISKETGIIKKISDNYYEIDLINYLEEKIYVKCSYDNPKKIKLVKLEKNEKRILKILSKEKRTINLTYLYKNKIKKLEKYSDLM